MPRCCWKKGRGGFDEACRQGKHAVPDDDRRQVIGRRFLVDAREESVRRAKPSVLSSESGSAETRLGSIRLSQGNERVGKTRQIGLTSQSYYPGYPKRTLIAGRLNEA
jgi:hypothetical protein